MAAVGSIEPFNTSSMDWATYSDCIDQYLAANAVDDGTVATFLTLQKSEALPTSSWLTSWVQPNRAVRTWILAGLLCVWSTQPGCGESPPRGKGSNSFDCHWEGEQHRCCFPDASELTATSGSAGSSVHAVRFKTGRVKGASDKASVARRSNTKPCYHCGR